MQNEFFSNETVLDTTALNTRPECCQPVTNVTNVANGTNIANGTNGTGFLGGANPFERKMNLTDDQIRRIDSLTEDFHTVYATLTLTTGNRYYKKLATRALEEASMWATRAITHR